MSGCDWPFALVALPPEALVHGGLNFDVTCLNADPLM